MSGTTDEAGHRQPLLKRIKSALAVATLIGVFTCGPFASLTEDAKAGGETRTIRIHHVHTGESLTVTYKIDGRYVPSALDKINYVLRDWRKNKVIRIDPKTIDLMWELHADLGSKEPVQIVCGYRTAGTNGFLKRIGRNVARHSQHIKGKAIDLYFPDVSTERLRNSALVRLVGGVGYYRRGGGPHGFVHIDSGNVRHWPRIAPSQLARIFRDNRSTVGRRITRDDQVLLASAETDKDKLAKTAADAAADAAVDDQIDEDIADAPAKTVETPPAPLPKPAVVAMAKTAPVPVPRDKPIDIYFAAAASMKITPAAAEPESKNFAARQRPAADPIGAIADAAVDDPAPELVVNSDGKGGFGEPVTRKPVKAAPPIRTVSASTGDADLNWLSKSFGIEEPSAPAQDQAVEPDLPSGLFPAANAAESADVEPAADGKSDMQEINRAGKGDLLFDAPRRRQKIGQLIGN
jgi:uncharacterized protein YcbK (DUF882 family)